MWLSFFLTTLKKQKKHLEGKLESITRDDTKLGKNARAIMALFDTKPEWSIAGISKTLGLNDNTAAKAVKALVDGGYLTKHGSTRGAWYEKP